MTQVQRRSEAGVAARRAAYRAVRHVHDRGAWASVAVDRALRDADLDARDRAFAANLAFQTLRWEGTLDWVLRQSTDRELAATADAVLDLLRLGAWQLLYGDAPDRAVVDTAVKLAKAEVAPRASGFINAVLRDLARRRDAGFRWPSGDAGLGLRTGYPTWIVTEARARFGDRAAAVLEAGNAPPGLTLRSRDDREALLAELDAAGLPAEPGAFAPEAVRVPGADPGRLEAIVGGRATPQDEASMMVARSVAQGVRIADDRPALVLDACAGPGGKATHLAQLGCRVVAADVRPHRTQLVKALARRMHIPVATSVADALHPPWRPASFDAVLVDAPCTGLGVVRRRPELRWRREHSDVGRLAALQGQLLDAVAPLVGRGGLLVYAACTWTVAETRDVALAFMSRHAGYAAEPAMPDVTGMTPGDDPGVQLDPYTHGVDGMYIACFRRSDRVP